MSRKNKSKSKSNLHLLAPEVVARVINEVRADRNYIPWVENLAFSDLKQRMFNFFSSEEDVSTPRLKLGACKSGTHRYKRLSSP